MIIGLFKHLILFILRHKNMLFLVAPKQCINFNKKWLLKPGGNLIKKFQNRVIALHFDRMLQVTSCILTNQSALFKSRVITLNFLYKVVQYMCKQKQNFVTELETPHRSIGVPTASMEVRVQKDEKAGTSLRPKNTPNF